MDSSGNSLTVQSINRNENHPGVDLALYCHFLPVNTRPHSFFYRTI